jgi:putative spermidine/putrescine transport system permease protein
MLSRLRGLAFTVAVACLLFPLWISVLVRTFSWILLSSATGRSTGRSSALVSSENPSRCSSAASAFYIGMVHVLLPYALLPIYSAQRNVDERLLQGERRAGASALQTFLRIYLPLTFPGIASGFLLVFLLSLGFFITPAISRRHRKPHDSDADRRVRHGAPRLATRPRQPSFWLLFLVLIPCRSRESLPQPRVDGNRAMTTRTAHSHEHRGVHRSSRSWLLPILAVIPASFKPRELHSAAHRHLVAALGTRPFSTIPNGGAALVASTRVALLATMISVTLGTAAALGLERVTARMRAALLAIVISPLIVPVIMTSIALYYVMRPLGLHGTTLGLALGTRCWQCPSSW